MKLGKLKYKKIVVALIIFSAVIYNEYSYFKESEFYIDDKSLKFYEKISGSFKLKVIDGGKSKIFSIENGKFRLKQNLPFPPNYLEQSPYNRWFMEKEGSRGENIEGYHYHGPYRLNKEEPLAVFSLSSKKSEDSPKSFVLVNLNNKTIISKSDLRGSIVDILWSPDSKIFSILERVNEGHPISILSTISAFSGHPQSLYSYFISFFDDKGNLLNRSKIVNKNMLIGVQLLWE